MYSLSHLLYLSTQEHIIHRWSDKTPKFHNTLILIYKKQVEERLPKYLQMTKGMGMRLYNENRTLL